MMKVSITPHVMESNDFVKQFSNAIAQSGFETFDARWVLPKLRESHAIILHWPDMFFDSRQRWPAIKNLSKIWIARRLFGARLVWVAHNLKPHSVGKPSRIAKLFVRQLDGVIHLSQASLELLGSEHKISAGVHQLVTVHGRYDPVTTPTLPRVLPHNSVVQLVTPGLIKPYKGIERAMSTIKNIASNHVALTIIGKSPDHFYSDELQRQLGHYITLDARSDLLSRSELEAVIDRYDAVLLPYTNILNSGSVLLALSRGRPVIAPKVGSLPEVAEEVGRDWVYLYEGDLTPDVLEGAVAWVRETPREHLPNLEAYDWHGIKGQLASFLRGLLTRTKGNGVLSVAPLVPYLTMQYFPFA